MELPLLKDIIILFGLAIIVILLCHRLKLPVIVGFFVTGIIAGPSGLSIVKALTEVQILAEIGIVLLLFTIGMEFSFRSLWSIKKALFAGGTLQVLLTTLAGFTLALEMGQGIGSSLFIGFLISLSSTAIVLKLLQERNEISSPHGSTTLAILIFQDIIVIPMMLFTPILAGNNSGLAGSPLILIVKVIFIIVIVFISARWIVPQILYQVARTRNREVFLLSIVVICFLVAWVTSKIGLSIALGAFLAGLIISESEYSLQALGNILPFRDIFTSLFFVSIGMLVNIEIALQQPLLVILLSLAVLTLKTIIAGGVTIMLGLPLRTGILVGFALSQIGEFSFILSQTGLGYGLLSDSNYQIFLSVSILTMALAPFLVNLAPHVADFICRLPLPGRLKCGLYPIEEQKPPDRKGHLVIIGFGVNGRNLARAAKTAAVPYIIIEMNPQTVRYEKAKGEPIYYGDATNESILLHADIRNAKVMVLAISDPAATLKITELARKLNRQIYIIVRTEYLKELASIYEAGANEVVPEEFETSVEIFTRVLKKYLVPKDEIEKLVSEIRSDNYEVFRTAYKPVSSITDLRLNTSDIEISTLRVEGKSAIVGQSLSQLDLRKKYGVTMLALRRNEEMISNPGSDMRICPDDIIILMGKTEDIIRLSTLLKNQE
jgi:CPA2 family monovalent cation:H+ antiporter-2